MGKEAIEFLRGIKKEDANHNFERRCQEVKKKLTVCCSPCICFLMIFSAIGAAIYGLVYVAVLDNCK